MSLSDKINKYPYLHKLLRVEDVKESIKRLKLNLGSKLDHVTEDIIDEEFGKDLI